MRLTDEQKTICNVFMMDERGKYHCHECPMRLSVRGSLCLANTSKSDAKRFFDWDGDPYPGFRRHGE